MRKIDMDKIDYVKGGFGTEQSLKIVAEKVNEIVAKISEIEKYMERNDMDMNGLDEEISKIKGFLNI